MPTIVSARTGDTFDSIARRVYGETTRAGELAQANPGLTVPFVGGESVTVPAAPRQRGSSTASDPDEVAIYVGGLRLSRWTSATVRRRLDAVDEFTLAAPFDPGRQDLRDAFRPLRYPDVNIQCGGEDIFTGTLVKISPATSPNGATVSVSGYALPGVLSDCTAPPSAYPIEYAGQNLLQIAAAVCRPFGIPASGESGPPFELVSATTSQRLFDFLTTLSKQRGYVIGSTTAGGLEIRRPDGSGPTVAVLREGEQPVISVGAPQMDEQNYYSSISAISPTIVGIEGPVYTARNERARGVLRPLVIDAPDVTDGELQAATQARLGRMFANVVMYSVSLAGWRRPDGELWEPGDIVTLRAPGALVYTDYRFEIRAVDLTREGETMTSILQLGIPGGLSGVAPGAMPWDE